MLDLPGGASYPPLDCSEIRLWLGLSGGKSVEFCKEFLVIKISSCLIAVQKAQQVLFPDLRAAG